MHFNAIDITNKRFGRLVALEPTNKRNGSNIVWKCKCDCGNICFVNTISIKNNTKSCGCLRKNMLLSRVREKNPNFKYGKKESHRRSKLKMLYNMSSDDYNYLLEKQSNVCAICGKKETRKSLTGTIRKLSVDHNHKNNKIRGLLCQRCNSMLGMCKDDKNILKNAIRYLEEKK